MDKDMDKTIEKTIDKTAEKSFIVKEKNLKININKNIDNLKKEFVIDEHRITLQELCTRLQTDIENGLTIEAAKYNLERDGLNVITPPKSTPEWLRFLSIMFNFFNLLLWIGSILCYGCYLAEIYTVPYPKKDNLYLSYCLAIIVTISGLFSYYQESKSENIMNAFKKIMPKTTTVIRSGQKIQILVEELVVGDLVEIRAGDQIPADLRIVKAHGLKVDNSSLTGESEPQTRSPNIIHENPLESKNLAFFSTNCIEGAGRGVVIRVGDNTSMGKIAILAASVDTNETPLSLDLHHFIITITYIALTCGLLLGFASVFLGFSILDSAILTVSLIIAQVPEGLIPTLTVVLTLTAKRMAKKNCLVKNLQAVETLGSTSTICTDKTGTLTQNKMTVSHVWCDGQIVDADKLIAKNDGNKIDSTSLSWKSLIRVCTLCSKAEFSANQDDIPIYKREALGDASEIAILRYMERLTTSVISYRSIYPKVFEVPFNSRNKYSISIHRNINDNGYWLCMKGAPERIADICSTIKIDGKEIPFDDDFKKCFNNAYESFGNIGERVIGLCELFLSSEQYGQNYQFDDEIKNFPTKNLCFVGLISMIDPPRPSVPDAVAKCRTAGIRIIMVTGDHPITAKAIARSVGIISADHETPEEVAERLKVPETSRIRKMAKAVVISGAKLREFSQKDLDKTLRRYDEIVFARTSPQQKLIIVEGCQRIGNIVAVTGDGVNDSPALKKANIGIAMGITGSDVSKQAADMILLDDNFASIAVGIEEGRVIFDNLKKSICYTLSSKIPEMMPFILYFSIGIPLALAPIYILCIDFGTDILPAISIGYEKAETDIMERKPRNPKKDRLVTSKLISFSYGLLGMMEALAGFFAWVVVLGQMGFRPNILFGIRKVWDSKAIFDFEDSYGQEWNYAQRKRVEYQSNTAFFAAVVLTKCAALIVCKTRRISFYQRIGNHAMNFAIIFAIALVIILTYTPGMEAALNMYKLELIWWTLPFPFLFVIVLFCELIKLEIRNHPGGWTQNEFYY